MIVYLAGRFTARHRLRERRQQIRDLGFVCDSVWMDSEDGDYPVPRDRALREASKDFSQVRAASIFILDTLDESSTGGREVEFGFYLGWLAASPRQPIVILVGPVRNIFHELAAHRCGSWDDALAILGAFKVA